MSETWTATVALLTFHCSQSGILMACPCARLVTWLMVGKVWDAPKVGHGRLVVNGFVLLQFFWETSFRWSHFLYIVLPYGNPQSFERSDGNRSEYMSRRCISDAGFLLGRARMKGAVLVGLPVSDFGVPSPALLGRQRDNGPWCHALATAFYVRAAQG